MSSTLSVLLGFYSLLLMANTVVSYLLWKHTQQSLFKTTFAIWGFCLVNFFLQGIFQEPGVPLLLSFGSYLFVAFAFLKFTDKILRIECQHQKIYAYSLSMALVSCLVWIATHNFVYSAIPMSLAIAGVLFFNVYLLMTKKGHRSDIKILCFFLVINGIHFLDYPFMRFANNGAIYGYSIALFILVMLSIFIPAFVVNEISLRYSQELKSEVNRQTQELQDLSEQNKTLLNIVCHDLATPLTVLQVSCDILVRKITDSQDPDVNKAQTKIQNALRAIKEILGKVRSLQALRSGKINVEFSHVNASDIVKQTLSLFEDDMKSKGIGVTIDDQIPPGTLLVADGSMIKNHVLNNLISNAIKFSSPNSNIEIALYCEGSKGFIRIKDQGIGMPAKILESIFDFSANTTRPGTNNEKGTGFGLPLAKMCIEMMGGYLSVSSQEKKSDSVASGTTFTIQLDKVG